MTTPTALTWPATAVLASDEREDEDPVLMAKIAKLNPTDRQLLEKQLSGLMRQRSSTPTVRRIGLSSALPLINRPQVSGEGLKAIPNPARQAKERKRRQFIDAFLKAHGIN